MTEERLLKLLGRRVRQLREERGLKQDDMIQLGFNEKYYQRIEYGQKNCTVRTLSRLAAAFKVSVDDLFDFTTLPVATRNPVGRPRRKSK